VSQFCAGIVTYQPDIARLKENITSVERQVERVYIVDNHSSNLADIRKVCSYFEKIVLIENNHNEGVAKAQNQLCTLADDDDFLWILTLDQDTVIPDGMIETYSPYTEDPQNGILCPAVHYEGWGEQPDGQIDTQYVYACMASGSLTKLEAWKQVGGFREDYFIDFVDNEFCMKLSLNQYKILRINMCKINHQLGDSGIKNLLGIKIRYSKHSPLRLYYMARNNYAFIKEYQKYLPVFKEKVKLYYILAHSILFSDTKKETMKYIRIGIRDAKKGINGEFKE
jgi:rhamnosyltransferase